MASEDPSASKRARLEGDGERQDEEMTDVHSSSTSAIKDSNAVAAAPSTMTQPDPSILAAARLKKIIQNQPSTEFAVPVSILAWSSANTIAVARSTRITIVHLLAPARVCHIATAEKPNHLSFSPRGDALLASFPESRSVCMWTCSHGTLNQWQLRGEWRQWEGRILDVKWLGAGRRLIPKDFRRTSARGPQLPGHPDGIAAMTVTDAGQLTLLNGRVNSTDPIRATHGKISLAPQLRLQQASIGLVPDEPAAIVAYTLRLSSKASLPHTSSGVEEALGMFFDDVQVTDAAGTAPPSDCDDRVELAEVRIDLEVIDDQSTLFLRPLLPIFTASVDDHTMPLAANINQLAWIDSLPSSSPSSKEDGSTMQLFASFFEDHTTTLRIWTVKREEVDRLSDAFSKLESAKDVKALDAEEDWVAQDPRDQKFEGQQLSDFVASAYAPLRFLCFASESRVIYTMDDVPKIERSVKLIELSGDNIVQEEPSPVRNIMAISACRLALSPHGTMAVALVRGKITVSAVSGLSPAFDSAQLYGVAVLQNDDLTDLVLSQPLNVKEIAGALHQNAKQLTLPQAKQLAGLHARSKAVDDVTRRSCHALLDLTTTLGLLTTSREAKGFRISSVWVIIARLEWMMNLLETTARQAHLVDVSKDRQGDNTKKGDRSEYVGKEEADMLSLFAHETSRKLACTCIMKLVAFCNWLDATMKGANEVTKQAFKAMSRDPYLMGNVLHLAHVRVREILLQSAVDLSKAGRYLKDFKDNATADDKGGADASLWYLAPTASVAQRTSFAQAFLPCVRNMLDLFCPQEDWTMPILGSVESYDKEDDEDANNDEKATLIRPKLHQRDILTKAILKPSNGSFRRLCLTCKGQTEVDVIHGVRCVCGAATWWATRSKGV